MACTTCAIFCASDVVGVTSVKLGFGTPASASSAFAFATSRFGIGMFFA